MEPFISLFTTSIQILAFHDKPLLKKSAQKGAVIAGVPNYASYVVNADILVAHP